MKRTVRAMAIVAGVMSWVLTSPARSVSYSSEATITVTGGPHAGVHALKVEDGGCELRKRPSKLWYFNDNFGLPGVIDPKKLSFVLVNMRNADGPGSPAPADFDASVTFGPVMGYVAMRLSAGSKLGSLVNAHGTRISPSSSRKSECRRLAAWFERQRIVVRML